MTNSKEKLIFKLEKYLDNLVYRDRSELQMLEDGIFDAENSRVLINILIKDYIKRLKKEGK